MPKKINDRTLLTHAAVNPSEHHGFINPAIYVVRPSRFPTSLRWLRGCSPIVMAVGVIQLQLRFVRPSALWKEPLAQCSVRPD